MVQVPIVACRRTYLLSGLVVFTTTEEVDLVTRFFHLLLITDRLESTGYDRVQRFLFVFVAAGRVRIEAIRLGKLLR